VLTALPRPLREGSRRGLEVRREGAETERVREIKD